ncbi:MAG: SAM-dependent methyltransferase [Gammaproteobacteria bacterium]|nr:SAM-dependent methyltransferase [Gammaproteobacteria bacterium]MBU6509923.1 SAM-dependent methyltransferase [Gammaproteobacteria bacterium]MDE1984164.1 SAM-dependent methyltransferase [Gammaproteobacteria bacterium]MDE2108533.1 SAM-dependent methyltransferase [Gammaproteobacteria bacterium]MDE2459647.1 SAM-dependent methyltransferase [Gammaproteobacteria bacterium]
MRISQPLAELPKPSADALAHSARLKELIRAEIAAAGGRLGFERFMELALYAPGLGYYSAGARKFGAAGDFVTAPELSPLFARCLAVQCAQVLDALGGGDILELGAGSGRMAAELLNELARLGALPQNYLILEVSAELRERQQHTLAELAPELREKVAWLERLPESFSGVILGNEVLDALPISRFRRAPAGFEEFCVADHDGEFSWRLRPAQEELQAALQALKDSLPQRLAEGYCSEISVRMPALIHSLSDTLARGALLLTDYGYPRAAYYHPERHMGTLMCHYRQHAHDDPFLYPGLQDITAHVDFTAVAEAGSSAGLQLAGYTTQAHFLLALGIADRATDLQTAREVKLLTLPGEMGERFKAIGFQKGIELPLRGFGLRDLSYSL